MKLTCKIMRVVQANKKSKHVFFWNSTVGTWNIRCLLGSPISWISSHRYEILNWDHWINLSAKKKDRAVCQSTKQKITNKLKLLPENKIHNVPQEAGICWRLGIYLQFLSCNIIAPMHPWGQGDNEFYMRSAEAHKTHSSLFRGAIMSV